MGRKKPVSSAAKSRKDPFPLHPAFVNPRAVTHDATSLLSTSPPKQATSSPDIGKQRHHTYRGATLEEQRRIDARKSARAALESRFIRLPPDVLEHYKTVLAKKAFERPIQQDKAWLDLGSESSNEKSTLLVPKRPKWKYYMLKKEVEKNEAVMFEKWLAATDETLKTARSDDSFKVMGYFERNLDVWRQLWRVSEASEILLVLLDVRCPLLHFPPSLQDYIATLKPRKHCILILTKVDLVPAPLAQSWKEYLEHTFEYPVVMVESYKEHERGVRTQGTRKRYDPGTSRDVRKQLVSALKSAHKSMTTPSECMNPERRSSWKPRCRCDIDWSALQSEPDLVKQVKMNKNMKERDENKDSLGKAEARKARKMQRQQDLDRKAVIHQAELAAREARADDGKEDIATESQSDEEDEEDTVDQPPYISIGLIGQPNVGKSSLLNALLGKKVVRASRTPGKTKHLQTIFWTPEVRLVDCPGLVFPSLVGMEKQVLSGIIPIQNVESVIYDLGQRMPLEEVLELPSQDQWSTDDLLSTFALERGFLTAKAARPDVYRAGSMIIRAVQASQIPWAFRPHQALIVGAEQEGIWIKRRERANLSLLGEAHQAEESTEAEEVEDDDASPEDGSEDEDSEVEEKVTIHPYFTSAFGALAVEEAEDSSADEQSDGSDADVQED